MKKWMIPMITLAVAVLFSSTVLAAGNGSENVSDQDERIYVDFSDEEMLETIKSEYEGEDVKLGIDDFNEEAYEFLMDCDFNSLDIEIGTNGKLFFSDKNGDVFLSQVPGIKYLTERNDSSWNLPEDYEAFEELEELTIMFGESTEESEVDDNGSDYENYYDYSWGLFNRLYSDKFPSLKKLNLKYSEDMCFFETHRGMIFPETLETVEIYCEGEPVETEDLSDFNILGGLAYCCPEVEVNGKSIVEITKDIVDEYVDFEERHQDDAEAEDEDADEDSEDEAEEPDEDYDEDGYDFSFLDDYGPDDLGYDIVIDFKSAMADAELNEIFYEVTSPDTDDEDAEVEEEFDDDLDEEYDDDFEEDEDYDEDEDIEDDDYELSDLVIMIRDDISLSETSLELDNLGYDFYDIPMDLLASSMEDAEMIVFIYPKSEEVGKYADGNAYKTYTNIMIVDKEELTIISDETVTENDPPEEVAYAGSAYGQFDWEAALDALASKINQQEIVDAEANLLDIDSDLAEKIMSIVSEDDELCEIFEALKAGEGLTYEEVVKFYSALLIPDDEDLDELIRGLFEDYGIEGFYYYLKGCAYLKNEQYYRAKEAFEESEFDDYEARAAACEQDWPECGELWRKDGTGSKLSLTIAVESNTNEGSCFEIISEDNELLSVLFVDRENTVKVKLPAGVFKIKQGVGDEWYGIKDAFGRYGNYDYLVFDEEAEDPYSVELQAGGDYELSVNVAYVEDPGDLVGADSVDWDSWSAR